MINIDFVAAVPKYDKNIDCKIKVKNYNQFKTKKAP